MTHKDYSIELNNFSYNFGLANISTFSISEETHKRIIVSKLYYALYHRILEELPSIQNSDGSNKHETIENILSKQANKGALYLRLHQLFRDLKGFRVWADYNLMLSMPVNMNLILLQRKTFDTIKYAKLIY